MSLNEEDLIGRYFAPIAGPAGLGLRDDAGLLAVPEGQDLVLTKDALAAGVHFFPQDPAASVARKALAVNLSDLAAKGARPLGFLLALALPPGWTPAWLEAFATALGVASREHGCPLIGGDTVATPGPLVLSITALGLVAHGTMVRRTGARPGDSLYVSGSIGDGALGLAVRRAELTGVAPPWVHALAEADREALRDRYWHPRPRLALREALAEARAAMDVSDGFVGDLSRLLRVSGATGRVAVDRVPLSAAAAAAFRQDPALRETILTGGDDYEILATVPPDRAAAFEAAAARVGVPVTAVGVVEVGTTPPLFADDAGTALSFQRGSYSHI